MLLFAYGFFCPTTRITRQGHSERRVLQQLLQNRRYINSIGIPLRRRLLTSE